jgi:hypothetical protein
MMRSDASPDRKIDQSKLSLEATSQRLSHDGGRAKVLFSCRKLSNSPEMV